MAERHEDQGTSETSPNDYQMLSQPDFDNLYNVAILPTSPSRGEAPFSRQYAVSTSTAAIVAQNLPSFGVGNASVSSERQQDRYAAAPSMISMGNMLDTTNISYLQQLQDADAPNLDSPQPGSSKTDGSASSSPPLLLMPLGQGLPHSLLLPGGETTLLNQQVSPLSNHGDEKPMQYEFHIESAQQLQQLQQVQQQQQQQQQQPYPYQFHQQQELQEHDTNPIITCIYRNISGQEDPSKLHLNQQDPQYLALDTMVNQPMQQLQINPSEQSATISQAQFQEALNFDAVNHLQYQTTQYAQQLEIPATVQLQVGKGRGRGRGKGKAAARGGRGKGTKNTEPEPRENDKLRACLAKPMKPTAETGRGGGRGRGTGRRYIPSYIPPEGKPCLVCSDFATGYHYRVMTCEGCKGFFRRSCQKKILYKPCKNNQLCLNNMIKSTRTQCQICRYQACITAGMLPEMVLTKEARDQKNALIKRNRELRLQANGNHISKEDTEKMNKMIEEFNKIQEQKCGGMDKILHNYSLDMEFNEQFKMVFEPCIKKLMTFLANMPWFSKIHPDDACILLQHHMFSLIILSILPTYGKDKEDGANFLLPTGLYVTVKQLRNRAPDGTSSLYGPVIENVFNYFFRYCEKIYKQKDLWNPIDIMMQMIVTFLDSGPLVSVDRQSPPQRRKVVDDLFDEMVDLQTKAWKSEHKDKKTHRGLTVFTSNSVCTVSESVRVYIQTLFVTKSGSDHEELKLKTKDKGATLLLHELFDQGKERTDECYKMAGELVYPHFKLSIQTGIISFWNTHFKCLNSKPVSFKLSSYWTQKYRSNGPTMQDPEVQVVVNRSYMKISNNNNNNEPLDLSMKSVSSSYQHRILKETSHSGYMFY